MKRKATSLVFLRDPNLSDRQLLRLTIFNQIKIQSEIRVLKELVLRQSNEMDANSIPKMEDFYFEQIFKEYERDIHNFVQGEQNVEGN